jgi:hypothetical protein
MLLCADEGAAKCTVEFYCPSVQTDWFMETCIAHNKSVLNVCIHSLARVHVWGQTYKAAMSMAMCPCRLHQGMRQTGPSMPAPCHGQPEERTNPNKLLLLLPRVKGCRGRARVTAEGRRHRGTSVDVAHT